MPYHTIPCHTMPYHAMWHLEFAQLCFLQFRMLCPRFFPGSQLPRGVRLHRVALDSWRFSSATRCHEMPRDAKREVLWCRTMLCDGRFTSLATKYIQIWYNAPLITPVTKVVDARMLHDARRLDGSCLPSRFTILLISLTRMRKQVAEKTGFRNFFSRFNLNLRIQLSQDWYGLIAPNPITRVQLDRSCSHHGTKPPGCHDPEPARTIWNHSKHLNPQDSEPLQPQQFARHRLPQGGSCGAEWYGNVINLERVAYDSQLWCLALLIWGSENWSVFGSISFKAARFSCEGCGSLLWNYLALEASGTLMEDPIQNLSPHCLSKSLSESLPWNWRLRVDCLKACQDVTSQNLLLSARSLGTDRNTPYAWSCKSAHTALAVKACLLGGNSNTKCSMTFVNIAVAISALAGGGGQRRFRTETSPWWCFRFFSRIFRYLSARGYWNGILGHFGSFPAREKRPKMKKTLYIARFCQNTLSFTVDFAPCVQKHRFLQGFGPFGGAELHLGDVKKRWFFHSFCLEGRKKS